MDRRVEWANLEGHTFTLLFIWSFDVCFWCCPELRNQCPELWHLSAFMKFIFTLNLVLMKLSSFMKSSLYIHIYIYILSYCYYNKLGLSHITYTLFFVRTKFIRTLSLRFAQMLRTFWTLKSPSFLIVLKVKYWGSKPPFLIDNALFCWLLVANFGKKW